MAKKRTPAKPKADPPEKRRARGTGTIFYDARRGAWVGRVPVGRTPAGSTKYVTRSAPTQRELLAAMAAARPPGPETTVGQWCERWLKDIDVRPGSMDSYSKSVRLRIKPALGHVRLCDLTTHQADAAVKKWVRDTSAATAALTLAHLHGCLEAAVRAEAIARNPAKTVRKPRATKKAIDPFAVAELGKVIAAATATPEHRIFAVLASVGCRSGEAMGLDVGDWDAAARTLAITKTQRRAGRGTGPPKSKRSTRTVRVPDAAVPAVAATVKGRTHGPLFPAVTGKRLTHTTLAGRWRRTVRAAGVPYRNPHQMRHAVATALVSAGVPIGDVAKFLGDSVATVVASYLHPSGADPSDTLDALFRTPPDAVR